MEKYIKSMFQPNEAKNYQDSEADKSDNPPLDGRRTLSTSRSGRLKHSHRKRHSLNLEVYGIDDGKNFKTIEKPKVVEYHVNSPSNPSTPSPQPEPARIEIQEKIKTPEDEIDTAFEIIDKYSVRNEVA